jgi:hypothetical protein
LIKKFKKVLPRSKIPVSGYGREPAGSRVLFGAILPFAYEKMIGTRRKKHGSGSSIPIRKPSYRKRCIPNISANRKTIRSTAYPVGKNKEPTGIVPKMNRTLPEPHQNSLGKSRKIKERHRFPHQYLKDFFIIINPPY